MRFCLYGQGEGLRVMCEHAYFVAVAGNKVTDVSLSARKKGVLPGMSQKTAESLLPGLTVVPETDNPTKQMKDLWRILWGYSPWLQTVDKDAFWMQLSGETAPLREVRDVLAKLGNHLSEEQRIRVGFAENPFLARALVEWSRIEKVHQALYCKVNRQHLIIAPSMVVSPSIVDVATHTATAEEADRQVSIRDWLSHMPIPALWMLSVKEREALLRLGVRRLQELMNVPVEQLKAHFGKESILWRGLLAQTRGGAIKVNYPPLQKSSCWQADVHNKPPVSDAMELVQNLSVELSNQLFENHAGAMKVGVRVLTDHGGGEYERVCKHPVYQSEDLLAHIRGGVTDIVGQVLEQIEVYVGEIRPLDSIQTSFVLREHAFHLDTGIAKTQIENVFTQINERFPDRIQFGLTPPFRELRLEAVLHGV